MTSPAKPALTIECPACNAIFVAREVANRCVNEKFAADLREVAEALERMHHNPASREAPDLVVACIHAVSQITADIMLVETIDLPHEAFETYLLEVRNAATAAHDAEVARGTQAIEAMSAPRSDRGPSVAIPAPKGGALA